MWAGPGFYTMLAARLAQLTSKLSPGRRLLVDWLRGRGGGKAGRRAGRLVSRLGGAGLLSRGAGLTTDCLLLSPPLPPGLQAALAALHLTVHAVHGPAELCGLLTANSPGRTCRAGTAGRPLPGTRLRLGEEGRVLATGRHLCLGYLAREAETAAGLGAGEVGAGRGGLDSAGFLVLEAGAGELAELEWRAGRELGGVADCIAVPTGPSTVGLVISLHCRYDRYSMLFPVGTVPC